MQGGGLQASLVTLPETGQERRFWTYRFMANQEQMGIWRKIAGRLSTEGIKGTGTYTPRPHHLTLLRGRHSETIILIPSPYQKRVIKGIVAGHPREAQGTWFEDSLLHGLMQHQIVYSRRKTQQPKPTPDPTLGCYGPP